jgi:hypothetical protein
MVGGRLPEVLDYHVQPVLIDKVEVGEHDNVWLGLSLASSPRLLHLIQREDCRRNCHGHRHPLADGSPYFGSIPIQAESNWPAQQNRKHEHADQHGGAEHDDCHIQQDLEPAFRHGADLSRHGRPDGVGATPGAHSAIRDYDVDADAATPTTAGNRHRHQTTPNKYVVGTGTAEGDGHHPSHTTTAAGAAGS